MKNTLNVINNAILSDSKAFIELCEKEYRDEVFSTAQIIADNDDIKIVALAGPSASGKTTSAHILAERLTALGEKTIIVSLDDFYYSGDELPVLPDGKKDIESVNALDAELIKLCLNEIIKTGKTMLPEYDFKTRTSHKNAKAVDIGERGIVIVEGLHALNPVITDLVPKENIYKIYISVNSGVYDASGKQLLSSRKIRLMRRALRDEVYRNSDINSTLTMWEDVVKGERKYLYCFKDTADKIFKTFHRYEPALYKKRFSEMWSQVNRNHKGYEYFCQTVKGVENFVDLPYSAVPQNSLIREFIGDGKYSL